MMFCEKCVLFVIQQYVVSLEVVIYFFVSIIFCLQCYGMVVKCQFEQCWFVVLLGKSYFVLWFVGSDIVMDICFQCVIVYMCDWFFVVKGLFFEIKIVVIVQIIIGIVWFCYYMKSMCWNLLQYGCFLFEVIF